jgi:hypothetical protein
MNPFPQAIFPLSLSSLSLSFSSGVRVPGLLTKEKDKEKDWPGGEPPGLLSLPDQIPYHSVSVQSVVYSDC